MKIFFVILILCFFFWENNSEFIKLCKLWKNSFENFYHVEIFIGSPPQFLPIGIDFFSNRMEFYCSNETRIYSKSLNNNFFYLPSLSKTSVSFQNDLNFKNMFQIMDNLTFKDSNTTQNNLKINCIREKLLENQSFGLFSPLFFIEEFPFILLCFHENGGYINLLNETIKTPMILNSFMIKTLSIPLIILNSSNHNESYRLGFVCENIGFKINNVFFLADLQQFHVFLSDSLPYHYFSTNLFLVLTNLLKTKFLIGYDKFFNERNCFIIDNLSKMKTEFPILILAMNNSEFLELNPVDYLKFYEYQNIVCLNVHENQNTSENFLSTIFMENAFIQIDKKQLSLKIIYQNCETTDVKNILANPSLASTLGNSINQIIINVLIALSCLILILGIIYSFYFVKIWLQSINFSNKTHFLFYTRDSQKLFKKKLTKKKIITADLTELKLEIIKDNQKNKKEYKNHGKKNLYIEKENKSEKLINEPFNLSNENKNKIYKKIRKSNKNLKNNFGKKKELGKIKEVDDYEEKKE